MASLLSAYLAAAMRRGFSWGTHDCMLFAAGWAERVAGFDPATTYRGRYDSEEGAARLLEKDGGPQAAMDRALTGWTKVNGAQMRGDIVLATLPRHAHAVAGIATDEHKTAFLSKRGLVIWATDPIAVWRWSPAHG